MMTPKMKEDFCTQILGASRQLFLSGRISEICREKGTQKQLEFILELLQAELTLRDENRRKRLIKRAGFQDEVLYRSRTCAEACGIAETRDAGAPFAGSPQP